MEEQQSNIIMKSAKLHPGQLDILKKILKSDAMYYTIVSPRQWGKSFFLIQLMLYYSLNYKNSKLLFCSPTYAQSSKVFKELINGIRDSGVIDKFNAAENSIILINGSEIYFKSIQQPDNLRGYSIDYLFMDEAAMYKNDIFPTVLRPMLTVRGKKCFLFSTPRGKNYFYNLYQKGINKDDPRYLSFKCFSADNPYANQQEIEDAKKALPESIFRQEYMAEFIDDGGSVFSNLPNCAILKEWQEPISTQKYYVGVDIGKNNDFLVATVMNNNAEVVYVYRDRQKSMPYMIKQLETLFNKYNPQYTLVETNGIGLGIYDFIKKLHRSVSDFTTTNKSKQDIIESLVFGFQDNQIKIPTPELFPELYDELQDFGFVYSPKTRVVQYAGITGHDDTVMSLAIANYARLNGISKGQYIIL